MRGGLSVEHLALYREWRPQLFQEVIGQEHVSRTLQNAVRQERVAHAYLFCGPRGTGKTSTARILAKAVNCPNSKEGEPCNNCASCRNITAGISMDVVEMDAASHRGIEEIRDLNQKVCFVPTAGKSRLFIIDEVHMLTGEAFNALLKTLEEPPRHTIFVLATTEAHKVPLTIMSRCQRFDFRRLGREIIKKHLRLVAGEKGWQIDDEALEFLSRHAGGALRDALGLLEQAASFTGGAISRADLDALTGAISPDGLQALLAAAMAGDVPSLLQQLDEIYAGGCEPRQLLFQLIDLARDRLFAAPPRPEGTRPGGDRRTQGPAPGPERAGYVSLLRGLAVAEADLRGNSRPDLALELALVRFSDAQAFVVTGGAESVPSTQSTPDDSIPRVTVSGSKSGGSGTIRSGVTGVEATAAPQAAGSVAAATTVQLGEIRQILGWAFQKQPVVAQALASCDLNRDGDRIILNASSTFDQETLLKDENRHRMQDALRQRHPALELEIVTEVGRQRPVPALREQRPEARGQMPERKKEDASASGQPGLAESTPADDGGQTQEVPNIPASDVRHPTSVTERQTDSGQDDPVGLALTLFGGKLINETEV